MQAEQLLMPVLEYRLVSRSWTGKKSKFWKVCRDCAQYCDCVQVQVSAFATRFSPLSTLPELENFFQLWTEIELMVSETSGRLRTW